jgi:hypothetical protein
MPQQTMVDPINAPNTSAIPACGEPAHPTPAAVANEDGTTDIYFGPEAAASKESNWIQTVPGKRWFTILRLDSPLHPFLDKTWQAGEIEAIG